MRRLQRRPLPQNLQPSKFMNEIENKPSGNSEVTELKAQCSALSRQVSMLILALFLVSGTLTVFLGIQARWLGKNLTTLRPQAKQAMEASVKEMPVINAFVAKLTDYGKSHTNFQPFIVKYGLTGTNGNALNPTAPE
jgi:hypothetical protein